MSPRLQVLPQVFVEIISCPLQCSPCHFQHFGFRVVRVDRNLGHLLHAHDDGSDFLFGQFIAESVESAWIFLQMIVPIEYCPDSSEDAMGRWGDHERDDGAMIKSDLSNSRNRRRSTEAAERRN